MAALTLEPAYMFLGVKRQAHLPDQLQLGLQKIDMVFFITCELLEQVFGHPVMDAFAIIGGLDVKAARFDL